MKDIYELLNEIDLDENEFVEMEVNELETAKVKNALKKSINEKKKWKSKSWRKNIIVASIFVCISATTIGLTFPSYAKNIPVIDNIFRFFDHKKTGPYDKRNEKSDISIVKGNGLYYDYKKFSNTINLTKESNGIKFTINDAVFDGKTVTLTYSIESNQNLGNIGIPLPKIKGMQAIGGSGETKKIDSNKYVGILTASNMEDTKLDVADIHWNIEGMKNPENGTVIKGSWNFAFKVDATDSKIQIAVSSAEKNGVKVNIKKITFNPMSFTVYYDQEVSEMTKKKSDGVYVELEIKDDLGNLYSGRDNGGMGKEGSYNISWSKTFGKLDSNAKELIITPHITLKDYHSNDYAFVSNEIHIKLKK